MLSAGQTPPHPSIVVVVAHAKHRGREGRKEEKVWPEGYGSVRVFINFSPFLGP